jgi:hypothetical protein
VGVCPSLWLINATLGVLSLRGEPRGEQELLELRRLVGEALAALPEENTGSSVWPRLPPRSFPGSCRPCTPADPGWGHGLTALCPLNLDN